MDTEELNDFLKRLYNTVKAAAPDKLVTYVNFPTTEYLDLSFLDFFCFNVYLESQDKFEAYINRLQNIANDKPLVMAELGLDSRTNGERKQAQIIDWQVRTAFTLGCAGAIVFSWTDEWHRGGHDVCDWDFGMTSRERKPKPALSALSAAFSEVPFPQEIVWPRISVVVCTYNGSMTIKECCDGLANLDYDDFEVIIVNDGSTDNTKSIAELSGFHVISIENSGLSVARNVGCDAATGEIIAYLDDDAIPDTHWLRYLAAAFLRSDFVAIGGPNIAPKGDGIFAECVDNAPGNPVHILVSDIEAEHIAGCNMAIKKKVLESIGGFDPNLRVAGDDVDICWRIQHMGLKIGYCAAAMVWHHRRGSIKGYVKQQYGYGKAEALLEAKWPGKIKLRWTFKVEWQDLWQRDSSVNWKKSTGLFWKLGECLISIDLRTFL